MGLEIVVGVAVPAAIMAAMDRSVAWRAVLLQGALVTVIAVVLGTALEDSFFVDWGWLAGPGVWGACALVTAAALRLPPLLALAGAALSGLPSLATVLAGVHWAGTPLALLLFGAWCGWLAARRDRAPGGSGRRPVTA